jgi:hypothetical protein
MPEDRYRLSFPGHQNFLARLLVETFLATLVLHCLVHHHQEHEMSIYVKE